MADQSVVIRFRALYDSKLSGLDRDLNRMASSAQVASAKAGAGLQSLARFSHVAGTALMVGVGAALAVGIKAAIDFESSFAGVRKTLDASEGQFTRLAAEIRGMAKEIPITVHELNRIAELGGQLGIPIEALDEFTEVIAKLAATTNLDIDKAATAVARIANVMGTEVSEFDNMGATIVDLGNKFASTEEEIVNFALRLSGIGKAVGISEQDVLGLATAFTSLGEPAERGATALQRTFIALQDFASAGGPGLKQLADLMGLTVEAAQQLIMEDPAQAFLAFEEGLGNVIDSGGDAATILDDLGLGAVRTTTLLLKGAAGVDVLADALETSGEAWDENAALEEEAAKRFGTTASQLRLLGNEFTDLRITLGNGVLPVVRDVIKFFGGFFGVLNDNLGVLQLFGVAIGVMAGARGLKFLIGTVGSAVSSLMGFRAALSQAFLMSGSWTTAIRTASTAVGGLGSVLGVAAIALGAVAIGMANARARTNEMNAAVSTMVDNLAQLREETGANGEITGETMDDVLIAMEKATAGFLFKDLNETQIRSMLTDLGMPLSDFTEMIISSGDEFEIWADTVIANAEDVALAVSSGALQPGDEGFIPLKEAIQNLDNMRELIATARQIRGEVAREIALREREAQLEKPSSRQAMHARQMQELEQRAITEAFQNAAGPASGLLDSISFILGEEEEKAGEILDEFVNTVREFDDEFQDAWDDVMAGFAEEFTGWEETWADYEKVPAISRREFEKQLRLWNKDQERLLAANRLIAEDFTFNQQAVWNSLPEDLRRGAAATLAESGPDAFTDLVGTMFEQVQAAIDAGAEVEELNLPRRAFETLATQWPLALDAAMAALPEEVRANTEAQTAAAEMAWEAFLTDNEWIKPYVSEFMLGMLEAFIEEEEIIAPAHWLDMTTVQKLEWLKSQGFDMAGAIATGFSNFDLAKFFAGTLDEAAQAAIVAADKRFGIRSPSTVFRRIGEQVSAGFVMGLGTLPEANRVFDSFTNRAMRLPTMMPAPQVTVESGGQGPTIIFEGDIDDHGKVIRSVQKGTALAGLVRTAETAPGRN